MYEVQGYAFYTQDDADMASDESKRAEYLKQRIDFTDAQSVLRVYKKALNERLFQTPVGISFLRELQLFLLDAQDIDREDIPPIMLYRGYDKEMPPKRDSAGKSPQKGKADEGKKQGFTISVIMNVVLIIAVISMFFITLNAEQPNILNYERAITNRYAQWEQDLTQREQAVRDKERELKIETE